MEVVDRAGLLKIQKGGFAKWSTRWFKLKGSMLHCYKGRSDSILIESTVVDLTGARVTLLRSQPSAFAIEVENGSTLRLQASCNEDMIAWVRAFERASEEQLSQPFNIVQNVHIEFDSSSGFSGMPKEWQELIRSSGPLCSD